MDSMVQVFRIGTDSPDCWPELVRTALDSDGYVQVVEATQPTSVKGVTSDFAYVASPQSLQVDLSKDASRSHNVWAAAFPLLKAAGTVSAKASKLVDLSCPASISTFLLELIAAGAKVDVVADEAMSFDPLAATIPLTDDGRPFCEELSSQLRDVARGPVLAGLLLANGADDASHRVSQASEGRPDYDYWHGLMHRREPDFGNAGYWFRRVGDHGAFDTIADVVAEKLDALGYREDLSDLTPWDPFAMIDRCRRAISRPECEEVTRVIQQIEFAHLLAYQA